MERLPKAQKLRVSQLTGMACIRYEYVETNIYGVLGWRRQREVTLSTI
jgi:hypothetical protein